MKHIFTKNNFHGPPTYAQFQKETSTQFLKKTLISNFDEQADQATGTARKFFCATILLIFAAAAFYVWGPGFLTDSDFSIAKNEKLRLDIKDLKASFDTDAQKLHAHIGKKYNWEKWEHDNSHKEEHKGVVQTFAISNNGRYIASISYGQYFRIWDKSKKKTVGSPTQLPETSRLSLSFSKEDSYLYGISRDSAFVWSLRDINRNNDIRFPLTHSFHGDRIARSNDGRFLAISRDGNLQIYDSLFNLDDPQSIEIGDTRSIRSITFSKTNKYLAVSTRSATQIFRMKSGLSDTYSSKGSKITHKTSGTYHTVFSPDEKAFALYFDGGFEVPPEIPFYLVDVEDFTKKRVLSIDTNNSIRKVVFKPTSDELLIFERGEYYHSIKLKEKNQVVERHSWPNSKRLLSLTTSIDSKFGISRFLEMPPQVINFQNPDFSIGKEIPASESISNEGFLDIKISSRNKYFAIAHRTGNLFFWSLPNVKKEYNSSIGHKSISTYSAFSSDGKYRATSGADGSLVLVETTKNESRHFFSKSRQTRLIRFSPNNEFLLTISFRKNEAYIWEIEEMLKNPNYTPKQFSNSSLIRNIRHSTIYNDEKIAYISSSREIIVRNLNSDEETFVGNTSEAFTLFDYSTEGSIFCTVNRRGIKIWGKTDADYFVVKNSIPEKNVTALKFSPDGKYIAFGTIKGNMFIYDVEEQETFKLDGQHTDEVISIDFTADQERIVSASADRGIRFWDTETKVSIGSTLFLDRTKFKDFSNIKFKQVDDKKVRILSVAFNPLNPMNLFVSSFFGTVEFKGSIETISFGKGNSRAPFEFSKFQNLLEDNRRGMYVKTLEKLVKELDKQPHFAKWSSNLSQISTQQHALANKSVQIAHLNEQIKQNEKYGKKIKKIDDPRFISLQLTRFGVLLLFLFLVQIFVGLYRYNMRLSTFYRGRAQAVRLLPAEGYSAEDFNILANSFTPTSVDLHKGTIPYEEILKQMSRLTTPKK